MDVFPDDFDNWASCLSRDCALWNRVALNELRFQGQRRHQLDVARLTLSGMGRELVLVGPSAHFTPAEVLGARFPTRHFPRRRTWPFQTWHPFVRLVCGPHDVPGGIRGGEV